MICMMSAQTLPQSRRQHAANHRQAGSRTTNRSEQKQGDKRFDADQFKADVVCDDVHVLIEFAERRLQKRERREARSERRMSPDARQGIGLSACPELGAGIAQDCAHQTTTNKGEREHQPC
jgi:hypothetical protein